MCNYFYSAGEMRSFVINAIRTMQLQNEQRQTSEFPDDYAHQWISQEVHSSESAGL